MKKNLRNCFEWHNNFGYRFNGRLRQLSSKLDVSYNIRGQHSILECETIYMNPVSEAELFSIIMRLRNTNSNYIFDVQVRRIKFIADIIAVPLAHTFNLCVENEIFSGKLQCAKVCVFYKKKSVKVI